MRKSMSFHSQVGISIPFCFLNDQLLFLFYGGFRWSKMKIDRIGRILLPTPSSYIKELLIHIKKTMTPSRLRPSVSKYGRKKSLINHFFYTSNLLLLLLLLFYVQYTIGSDTCKAVCEKPCILFETREAAFETQFLKQTGQVTREQF